VYFLAQEVAVRRVLLRGFQASELLRWYEGHASDTFVEFHETSAALDCLRTYLDDPLSMWTLRDTLAEEGVKIGYLDPVEEVSGQVARLANLGYYVGALDQPEPDQLRSAIEEFQCDHFPEPRRSDGVPVAVNGICDPKTQAKLQEVHGC
jgi:hypothetical protein